MQSWNDKLVSPTAALTHIRPGMKIFIATGVSEPRALVSRLMAEEAHNLQDLEVIQLVSLGELITLPGLKSRRFRLKTFFSGWAASEAVSGGFVDLIPCRFSRIPALIESGHLPIDAAFIQITPPDERGYCGLGVSVDVVRQVAGRAKILVGEINAKVPRTMGDTLMPVAAFDHLVVSDESPPYFPRWPVDDVYDRVAAQAASVIEDGSCISFSIGPIYEALSRHLIHKRDLGIHTPIFTDALMDIVQSGAVTNRLKGTYRGKSLTSYAIGSRELMDWLNGNPLVEFQGIDLVFNPAEIGRNPKFMAVIPARKVDISGCVALPNGKGAIITRPSEIMDFIYGAELSPGGCTLFALPSRNSRGEPNILPSVEAFPNLLGMRESVDMVATEYGVANLKGRSLRERAQALIDIAHPDDRHDLMEAAKAGNIIYTDQIFLSECAARYPAEIGERHTFKHGLEVRFRHIRPSDEEDMRRLFYRFSDAAVYSRYFSTIKTMPHAKMQEYVNVDCNRAISIVGLTGPPEQERIIAEARYVRYPDRPHADVAFIVDEAYQGLGIATRLFRILTQVARERGLKGFTADVLGTNKAMLKVFEKGGRPVKATIDQGIYELSIPFED
ncbi:MAG: GNAT family N-acetyltransferase [Syntrophaceae bacterium]